MALDYPKRMLREKETLMAAGTSDDLEFGPVPIGEQWFVKWATLFNDTTAFTRWGVFIKSVSTKYWLDESAETAVDVHHGVKASTWLREGETLVIRVIGATADDALTAYITGTIEEITEGLVPGG